ncbi:HK97-gp10 family putative phage morphogenesis protein [Massilia sp. BKSP1R2A-1]|uniref:HK97-gp10 family putative phage morphogenesis protein n=1 Tax=Massilia sp. BKSP1R2A-1 TaxID=3422595 RepID=UPI003D33A61D
MIDFDPSDLVEVVQQTAQDVIDSVDEPVLRAVAFAGADLFREQAKQNALAHAKTYTIHRNIIVKRLEEESDGGVKQVYLVTVRKGRYDGADAFYWRFVEEGHKFVPKNTNVSARTGRTIGWAAHRRAAELEYGSARVPAYPFMRPAYETCKQDAVDVMTETLKLQLERNAS